VNAGEIIEQIRALPAELRREVLQRLRDEFAEFDDEMSPEEIAELERRSEEALQNPEGGIPWEQAHADVLKRLGR